MKSKYYLNLSFLLYSILCLFFAFSCSINENDELVKVKPKEGMLSFKNIDEYKATVQKLSSLSVEELITYEKNNGYKSFGKKSERIYKNIDIENISSVDELKAYVEKNKDYLRLSKNEDGEYVYETVLDGNPFRYIINEDRLFIIGNSVYKVFEDGVVSTDIENIDKLQAAKSLSVSNMSIDCDLSITPLTVKNICNGSKDSEYNCGTSATARATDDRDRTKIEISIGFLDVEGNEVDPPMTIFENRIFIRPYKRTLGIWYWCSRTISCDLKIAVDYETSNGWKRGFYFKSENGNYDSKLEYVIEGGIVSIGTFARYNMHYAGYDCWADTPSTDRAVLQCNTNLF